VAPVMGLSGAETFAEVGWLAVAASCAGLTEASAIGSFFLVTGDGVSTNMIDGPDASSRAIAVRGTVFDVNFGDECSSIGRGGASARLRDDEESCDEELAALCAFLVFRPTLAIAVSDDAAP